MVTLMWGCAQGLVLSPMMLDVYMELLGEATVQFAMMCAHYKNDTQLCITVADQAEIL